MSKASDYEIPQQYDDPEDQTHHLQVKQLDRARQKIYETRNKAAHRVMNGTISEEAALLSLREVIENYAVLLAPYLRSDEIEAGTVLWESERLGVVQIQAPRTVGVEVGTQVNQVSIDDITPEGKKIAIDGVEALIRAPQQFTATFTATYEKYPQGIVTTEVTESKPLSRTTLDSTVVALDEFRRDVGLGLSLPEEVGGESPDPY